MGNLKRMLSAVLALVMVASLLPTPALAADTEPIVTETTAETEAVEITLETTAPEVFAEETAEAVAADAPISGNCGENLTWNFDESTGILTISGLGKMYDYEWDDYNNIGLTPWYINGVKSKITSVNIENGVISIGDNAFRAFLGLTSITIPDSVTSIGNYAFTSCQSLTSLSLPDGITSIGDGAFWDCHSLVSIPLPDGITRIGDRMFDGCYDLASITLPESVISIGNYAFYNCRTLTEIRLPAGITYIGNRVFGYCDNLISITIPEGVTSIGECAFLDCESLVSITLSENLTAIGNAAFRLCGKLVSITIPDSVESIGEEAFYDCKSLTSIAIPDGVVAIEKGTFRGCKSLINITLPDSVESIGDSAFYDCDNLVRIPLPNKITYIGINAFSLCDNLISMEIPKTIEKIGNFAFSECYNLISLVIPESVVSIGKFAFYDCKKLGDIYYGGSQEQWVTLTNKVSVPEYTTIHFNSTGSGEEIPPEESEPEQTDAIREYLNSSKIKINGSGSAVAYYLGDANQVYQLTVNGDAQKVTATNQGVIRVPLGTFQAVGTEAVTVEITHVGDEALAVPQIFQHTVQVTPLAFSQSWKGSMDASVGAKLIAGAKVPVVNLEASLGEVGGKAGVGAAMNISRSYSAGGETLTITSDKKIEAGGTVKCGITGEVLSAEFNSGASLGIGCSDTITYGLKLNNYSAANKGQQRALATYLLGEALAMNPANTLYIPFYKYLAEIVYDDSGCGVIQGSASKMSGSFGAGVSQVSINGVDIANVLNGKVEATFIQSSNAFSDGTQEKSMSGKLSASLSTVTPAKKVEGSEIGANSSLLRADFLGTDVKISAERYKEERKLESTSLSSLYTQVKFLEIGVPSTAVYNKYIFKDKALDGLLSSTSHFDDYINHNLVVLSLSDLCELADVLSESDVPIEYREETKEKYAVSLPLEFDIGLGAGASFGITLSYLEDTGYTSATGYAVNDEILLTSESDDLSSQIRKNKRELGEIFVNCIQTLAEDAANFFQSIGNAIQEGVESTWSWIEGKAESMANWIISITSAPSENDGPWKESSKVGVKGAQVNFSLARQVIDPSEAYATRSAMTIGRPFVVNVTDNTTGEAIGNFEEEPLEFTIRYAGEDLMAANYDAETQVISMYRYSDDGDYFEYIGGIHDAEANTVTAIITKPGQYILAAEVMEEEEPGEDTHNYQLGDVNHDTKINAKDATLILQKSVGVLKETTAFCEDCAEVSGDGRLNAKDSTLILQFSVGLRDSFLTGK